MADVCPRAARAQAARGREREGVERRSGAARACQTQEEARTRGNAVGAWLACSRDAEDTCCPLWHSTKQVVGARVAVVGHRFGPVTV
jgi:hypothetical protein